MANLTEISIASRKLFIWTIFLIIGYFIFKFFFNVAAEYYKASNPPPVPLPNVRFNKLPHPQFTNISRSSSGLKFSLKNISGRPPETTSAAKVYFMPKKAPSLLSIERAQKFAVKLGFETEPDNIEKTIYYFTSQKEKEIARYLKLDTTTLNFNLKYDYQNNPQVFDQVFIRSKEQAINEVKNFLKSSSAFDSSILEGKITTDLLKYDSIQKKFLSATSLSTANTLRINFFRNDLDGWKILPSSFSQSPCYVLYTPSAFLTDNILEIGYTFWPIDESNFATYPLRSGQMAWQDLVDGYALVVNMKNNTDEEIVVRNIYLAYYDSEIPQNYLQPIFVFEGDNDFVAYLPAIINEWLE